MMGGAGPPGVKFVPMLSFSERYDSNVFFTPKITGLNRADYVTTVSPQLFIRDNARVVATTLQLGAVAERYANNPGLNYFGYNAGLNFGLSGLIGRVFPGTTLYVSDSFSYTPILPAFLGGGSPANNQIIGNEATQELTPADTFTRGVQASRVNTTSNSTTVAGATPLSANAMLQMSYTFAFIKFGAPTVNRTEFSPVFLETNTHVVTAGPQFKLSPQDLVTMAYGFSRTTYSGQTGGYDSHSITGTWQHYIARNFTFRLFAGGAVAQEDTGGRIGGSQASQTFVPTGGASVAWNASLTTSVTMDYSTGVYPSYQVTTGPLYSHVVGVSAVHRFSDFFGSQARVNYSRNDAIGKNGGSGILFDSYTATLGLYYRVSSWAVATLTGGYGYYKGNYSGSSAFSANTHFDRTDVTFGFTTYWQ